MQTPQDYIEAHRDAIMIRAGLLNENSPAAHPNAAELATSGDALIPALASFIAAQYSGKSEPVRGAGFGTKDFAYALADVLRLATQNRMVLSMQHADLCVRVSVPNFMPHKFPTARIDSELLPEIDGGEYEAAGLFDLPGLSAKLNTYGRNVLISRPLLLADDIGLVTSAFANFGASAARREAKLAYALLESNPTLSDGESMFAGGHGNVLAAALDEANLGIAMGMLRGMPDVFKEVANYDAAILVVHGNLELLARRIVLAAGLDLKVIASPWLAAGRWYVLPSPEVAPVIGLLRLGNSKSPVLVSSKKDTLSRDGTLISIRADLGVVALGRASIKGGA
ncbi:MAG: phage major capsid protein [Rhodocyclaceae bacterium]